MIGLVCPQSGCGGAVVLDSACRAGSVSLRELRAGTGSSVCVRRVALFRAHHVQCRLTQEVSSASWHRVCDGSTAQGRRGRVSGRATRAGAGRRLPPRT